MASLSNQDSLNSYAAALLRSADRSAALPVAADLSIAPEFGGLDQVASARQVPLGGIRAAGHGLSACEVLDAVAALQDQIAQAPEFALAA